MSGDDAYKAYLHDFFGRWSPLYDAFARPIGFAYGAAARAADARPGRSVLDLCTGTGELALRAARRGAAVTAVDFTPAMLARAERKTAGLPVLCLAMDARRLEFPDGSFDVAVLSFALHDMPRSVRPVVLREAMRVAREGVVVLDYAAPRSRPGLRLVTRALMLFETAFLPGFLSDGGSRSALLEAGLLPRRCGRPLPGVIELWRARPAPTG